jgi:prevent-host-death family protein
MEVGLRELRQNASEIVKRAEGGETVVVTVSGRPAAQLVPVPRRRWRRAEDLRELAALPPDEALLEDTAALDQSLSDPFAR